MAEIKIQRKRHLAWWPILLLLLIPLAWYLYRSRFAPTRTTDAPPRASAFRITPHDHWRADV